MKAMRAMCFRASPATRGIIEAGALAAGISIQDFIASAVEAYTKRNAGVVPPQMGLWKRYVATMPQVKVLHMVEVMKLDLKHYGSSRIKRERAKRGGGAAA